MKHDDDENPMDTEAARYEAQLVERENPRLAANLAAMVKTPKFVPLNDFGKLSAESAESDLAKFQPWEMP